jgi:multidrug transporter EmrE-like cation transporter
MSFVYIGLTILFTVVGQLLIKMGMSEMGASPGELDQLFWFALKSFLNWKVLGGLTSAGAAAVAWMMALSRTEISFAYPFMGLSIVLVLAFAPAMFGEHVPMSRWIGVGVVCLGLWIAAQG